MKNTVNAILSKSKLRNTAVRTNILQYFLDKNEAISHKEIEDALTEIDRSTVYRTLKTFEEKGIIHQAYHGGSTPKYALCEDDCDTHRHEDNHAHFSCENCLKTFCVDSIKTPQIAELKGYKVTSSELILKGYCDNCRR